MMEWAIEVWKGQCGLLDVGRSVPKYTRGEGQSNVQVTMERKMHNSEG